MVAATVFCETGKMKFTPYQKFVIAILAFINFTVILDFIMLSPLGAMLMPALHISTAQFGSVVSAYAFAAGASGLLSAGLADRFDRKKFMMFFYAGFVLGTVLCGIADTYEFLMFARIVTGLFGGVIGSVGFAIITDLFPYEMRGRVMGFVQTAFAASQVLGIPVGIYFANQWNWHAPFLMTAAISLIVGAVMLFKLKPINAHLEKKPDRSAVHHLLTTVSTPRYLQAFSTTALLSVGGFMLMPFGSAYAVNNLKIGIEQLPLIYLITGFCAIFTGPLVGRLADRFGKFRIYMFGSVLSIVMVLIYTRLGPTPLWGLIAVMAVMFVGISSRMIPSQALMSAIPEPLSRGSFMAVSSSIQQLAGGLASVTAGHIVSADDSGVLQNFPMLGNVVVGASLITLVQMYYIARLVQRLPAQNMAAATKVGA
jgi:predicted MFS family arabinose efflux permease